MAICNIQVVCKPDPKLSEWVRRANLTFLAAQKMMGDSRIVERKNHRPEEMSGCCQGTSQPTGKLCADCPSAPKQTYISIASHQGEVEIARLKHAMGLNADDPITADKAREENEALIREMYYGEGLMFATGGFVKGPAPDVIWNPNAYEESPDWARSQLAVYRHAFPPIPEIKFIIDGKDIDAKIDDALVEKLRAQLEAAQLTEAGRVFARIRG